MREINLPKGWKWVRLGNVVEFIKGRVPSKLYEAHKKNTTRYLTPDYLRGTTQKTYYCDIKETISVNEDIVILWDGSNAGEVFFVKNGGLASTMVKVKLTTDELSNKFAFYFLKYKEYLIKYQIKGSGIPHVEKGIFNSFLTIYPPLTHQKKIAEILEALDKIIEKTEKIIEKYKRIKQGLMQKLFTKGIDENGKIRDEKTHKFKDSPLGRIPEEWEVVSLGEVIDIFDNERIPLDEEYRTTIKGNIPYCGATGIIDFINDFIFYGEHILIAEDGGKFGRFEETAYRMNGKFWANNHVHVVRGKHGKLDNLFLMYYINLTDISLYISGSTREKLNQQLLKLIFIPLPSLPEQERIAQILSHIDKVIESEQKYKQKLENLKRGLMEDLLTGKVEVNKLLDVGADND